MDFDDHDDDPDDDLDLPSPKPPSSSSSKPSSSSSAAPRYRECLKNHAVSIGGNAVDGCGEFMPAGDDGSMDALRCAACNCHRNFHRREYPPSSSSAAAGPTSSHFSPYYRTPAGYLHPLLPPHRSPTAGTPHLGHHHLQPPLALPSTSAGGGAQSRGDDDELSAGGAQTGSGSRKRFRTKFTAEQKEKMLAFAERVGWRIQKHDEAAVQEFCNEAGVKRHVLKVWMHNNKHTLGKKP